jgi:hypothetical protein
MIHILFLIINRWSRGEKKYRSNYKKKELFAVTMNSKLC